MNQSTREKITNAAPFLQTELAHQAREYLDKPYRTALDVLDVMSGGWTDYQDVSEQVGISTHTVKQILHALSEGGFSMSVKSVKPMPKNLGGRPKKKLKLK